MTADLLKFAAPPPEDWPELVPLDVPNLPRLNLTHLHSGGRFEFRRDREYWPRSASIVQIAARGQGHHLVLG